MITFITKENIILSETSNSNFRTSLNNYVRKNSINSLIGGKFLENKSEYIFDSKKDGNGDLTSPLLLNNLILDEVDFNKLSFKGAVFTNSSLKRANLSGCRCDFAFFEKVDLTGANFEGADLAGVKLNTAILVNTNMINAILGNNGLHRAFSPY